MSTKVTLFLPNGKAILATYKSRQLQVLAEQLIEHNQRMFKSRLVNTVAAELLQELAWVAREYGDRLTGNNTCFDLQTGGYAIFIKRYDRTPEAEPEYHVDFLIVPDILFLEKST